MNTNRWKMDRLPIVAGIALLLCAGVALAGPTPSQKCEVAKLKAVSRYAACRLKADSIATLKGAPADYSKCDLSIAASWSKAELAGGCGTTNDLTAIQAKVSGDTSIVVGDLANDPLCGNAAMDAEEQCDGSNLNGNSCSTVGFASGSLACTTSCHFDATGCTHCGDGVKNTTEACDASDLGGTTCSNLGYSLGGPLSCTANCTLDVSGCVGQSFPATGQTSVSAVGDDGTVQAGATLSFVDNADGTVTDLNTKLQWEKKDARGGGTSVSNLHDVDNCYPWGGSCSITFANCGTDSDCSGGSDTCLGSDCQGGTLTAFEWVGKLNTNPCFAGHCDWRLPNEKELASIIDSHFANPAVSRPAFRAPGCGGCLVITDPNCSCTASDGYWSSTTYPADGNQAYVLDFTDGLSWSDNKWDTTTYPVRAVRGGL